MPPRRSRPASAQPAQSRACSTPPPVTVDSLRQRATQLETTVREMQEELNRTLAQHEREVDALQREQGGLLERLDEMRMEECLSPDELQAARGDGSGAGGGRHAGAFKLVASSTPAYQSAKQLIEEKRAECDKAEKDLEAVRIELSQMRQERVGANRSRYASTMEAYMQSHSVQESHMQVRDLIRVLETHIGQELDKLSNMTSDAKTMRHHIDTKLITQTRYERNYARRVNELLERKKQMSFLTEVCQTFFDERAIATEELRRMQALASEEDRKYEAAFNELTSVEQQNAQKRDENAQRIQQLRDQVTTARQERLVLEATNEKAKRELANGRIRSGGSVTRNVVETADDLSSRDSRNSQNPQLDPNSVEGRIAQFESHLHRLSDIAGAETAQDVVNFLETSADDRFRCFSEVRTLEEEMQQLEAEKASLVDAAGALGIPSSPEQEARIMRMRAMQQQLTKLKAESLEQEESAAECDLLLEKVVEQVAKMFTGLGCSVPTLRETTGSELVLRATCQQALGLVEQRLEEYLIAYSRRQQQLATTTGTARAGDSSLFQAAKPLLRRADLPPKATALSAEHTMQEVKALPYSGELGDDTHSHTATAPEDRILSTEELRTIAHRRVAV